MTGYLLKTSGKEVCNFYGKVSFPANYFTSMAACKYICTYIYV